MKKLSSLIIILSLLFSSASYAHGYHPEDYDKSYVLPDLIVMRPLGLAATIAGTALFIVISPLTALAYIPEPHDSFEKTANQLIFAPGHFTFSRPLGHKSFIEFPDP